MRCVFFFLSLILSLQAQQISVIGIGRTGLCLALCLEKAGYEVIGVDLSSEYIQKINDKTLESLEPDVELFLRTSSQFKATTSLDEALHFSDIYFIVVPTNPSAAAGQYNCEMLDHVLDEIAARSLKDKHVVIVSTVFPGYIRNVAIPKLQNCSGISISYNPMFIAQGDILKGMRYPEVVLIGSDHPNQSDEIEKIQANICVNQPYFARMSPDSAEIAKLALNCFVTMKIAFSNLVADIADATPRGDKEAILCALGKDSRVGGKCIMPGYGFGGPCFPRDNRALGDYADLLSIEPLLFRATDEANRQHAQRMADEWLKMNLDEYVLEDVCYKPKCPVPIIEESQKLVVAKKIAEAGKIVIIKDRSFVIQQVQEKYGDLFQYEVQ